MNKPTDPFPTLPEQFGLPVTWPYPWGWPPIGPCEGMGVDDRVMLVAELERDRIIEFVGRKADEPGQPTLIGAYRWKSYFDTQGSIPGRAKEIALGRVLAAEARSHLAYACPEHMDAMLSALDAQVEDWKHELAWAERRIRAAVRPLIEQRAASAAILAAADRVRGCMPKRETWNLCHGLAQASLRRSRYRA